MKLKDEELKERAMKVLRVSNVDKEQLRKAYRKKVREVHPDISNKDDNIIKLVIQSYAYLIRKDGPTSHLENDELVSSTIGSSVTPIQNYKTYEQWLQEQFFVGGIPSI